MPAFRLRAFDPSADSDRSDDRRRPQTGGEIIRLYMASLLRRHEADLVTKAHYLNYRRSLEAAPRDPHGEARYTGFIEVIGDVPVGDLIQDDLERWIEMNPQWGPDARRNNSAAAIACFNWASSRGLLKPSPFQRSEPLKEVGARRRDATDVEAERMWAAAPLTLRRILWLIDVAGLRTCEARELRWDWIDWENGVIRFAKHKALRRSRQKQARIVGLDASTLAELRRWFEQRPPSQTHVFVTARGRPWKKGRLCEVFREARAKAGLPSDLTPYCFRHRFCTQARLGGADVADVSAQMGHAGVDMTEHYSHLADKPEHQAARATAARLRAEAMAKARKKQIATDPTPLFDGLD